MTNKFTYLQDFDEYCEYYKELFMLPDDGYTSIGMVLTFNTEKSTCYYIICTHNNAGTAHDWEHKHDIPWLVGLGLLTADGVDIPNCLKETK
jgi:hypothetical protein